MRNCDAPGKAPAMKSRSSSPQTTPKVVRLIRVNSNPLSVGSSGPPLLCKSSIRIEDVSPAKMSGLAPVVAPSPNATHISPSANQVRRQPSHENSNLQTPARDALHTNGTPSSNYNPATSPGPETSPAAWSSAVGHATTTGKSGRVIERLMTENDKLKRDLNAQVIRCQELEKSMQTFRPQIDALRQENDNLSHARGVDSSLIARRDRKIEELKADLASERSRREHAEELARKRELERVETEEQSRREVQSLTESTRHATLHAEILETSHKQLSAEYRARAEAWKKDLSQLADGREQDRQKLAKLDIVSNHMRQELERGRRINSETVEKWERLHKETSARLRKMEHESDTENDRLRHLSDEMDKVVKEMRWVMGIKRNTNISPD